MEKHFLMLLEKCALFRGHKKEEILPLLNEVSSYRETFSSGEEILTRKGENGRIGILLKGKLTVFSCEENGTPLNTLQEGDLFGVSVLFGNCGARTCIKAKTEAAVLFIEEEKMEPLWEDKEIRKNLVSFLTDRICFLNQKISNFTAGSAEGKLARYLLQNASEEGICTVNTSLSQLAKSLNLGRASLYRAMEKMEQEKTISRDKKTIFIKCRKALEIYF